MDGVGYHWEVLGPCKGVPELELFGYRNLRKAVDLGRHHHGNAFEFHLFEKGCVYWEVGDEWYETIRGDAFLCRPRELHRGRYDVMEPSCFWWLILQVPSGDGRSMPVDGWLGLTEMEAQRVIDELYRLPQVVRANLDTIQSLRRLRRSLEQEHEISVIQRRILVLDFLFALMERRGEQADIEDESLAIRKVCRALTERPWWRPSVEEQADMVSMSKSHFHRTFRKVTGMTPMAYQERIRVEEAIRMLEQTDDPVTEIALSLGYVTSQHFATAFKRMTNRTPTQWRNESAGK